MNIFALDKNPTKAAQQHCDKHVVKMILESAQMLSTAHRILDGKLEMRRSSTGKTMQKYWVLPDAREIHLYKAVHTKHPCTIWTMESKENYTWHYRLFNALLDEYTYRYGKKHASAELNEYLIPLPNNMPNGRRTKFKLAMGSNPECMLEDPIESYRRFYETKQERFKMTWKKRETPKWFNVI